MQKRITNSLYVSPSLSKYILIFIWQSVAHVETFFISVSRWRSNRSNVFFCSTRAFISRDRRFYFLFFSFCIIIISVVFRLFLIVLHALDALQHCCMNVNSVFTLECWLSLAPGLRNILKWSELWCNSDWNIINFTTVIGLDPT